MTDLSDIVNLFGNQNNLSGLQQWAQAGGAQADPDFKNLAQLAPRTYEQLFPQIAQRQMQMSALSQLAGNAPNGQQQQSNPAPVDPNGGDSDPNSPVPQGLPGQMPQNVPQRTQASPPPNSALASLSMLPAATMASGGDPDKGS